MSQNVGEKGLARYLSRLDVWAMAFGCMVGWGAFVMPGTTFLPVAGPAGTVISMLLSTAIMLIIGANFSFQMARNPGTGGVYSYTKNAFGRDHAFLCSWFLCLSYLTIVFLNATALFIVIRTISGSLLQRGYHYVIAGNDIYLGEVALSVAALAGGRPAVRQGEKAAAKTFYRPVRHAFRGGAADRRLLPAPGDFQRRAGRLRAVEPWRRIRRLLHCDPGPLGLCGLRRGILRYGTLQISHPAGKGADHRFHRYCGLRLRGHGPDQRVGGAGTLRLLAGVYRRPGQPERRRLGAHLLRCPHRHGARWADGHDRYRPGGHPDRHIGAYRAATRVLSTMAEDNILSEKFSNTTYSILFVMVIAVVIAFLGRNALNWFVELTSFGAVVGFAYTSASAWKLARKEGNRKIMVTGAVGTVITAAFGIVHLIPRLTVLEAMGSASFLLLSLWCLLGFIFYWRTVNNSSLTVYSGMSASGVVLFSLLLYSVLMWFAKLLTAQKTMEDVRFALTHYGVILLLIVFAGLVIMLYVQNLVRKKHETLEREKIRAVEGSLAKSQFLFNMSHDIRTPMNAIIGYTNLALQEDAPPTVREYLSKIDTSSQHLLNLINDVLEMSRIESGKIELAYEPADLCRMVMEIHDLFTHQMEQKRIDFTVNSSQVRNRYVWCDRKNLNRVLLNIISNAYKFTPEGGCITASIWEIGSGENGCASYEIRVQDNGIGMSREFAERMFNAFERERTSTVSKVEGTGLGLAITKRIIDLMDGTIEVITSPGSGTEMIVRLKLQLAKKEDVPEEQAAEVAEAGAGQALDFTRMRLLLVEDNDINREIAQMILSQAGFSIETAVNGQIAVDMVPLSEPGYYDAVLMDIQMPVMDGYAATRAIRALEKRELAQIPIIAMTANAFKEDEQAAADAGMQAHIAKPLDVDTMLKTIGDVLSKTKE